MIIEQTRWGSEPSMLQFPFAIYLASLFPCLFQLHVGLLATVSGYHEGLCLVREERVRELEQRIIRERERLED